MKNPTLAVIAFPGNNCEIETARAARRNGFDAEILRWNEIDRVDNFDAYILPGGFSFEDRGRSGSIAAREPIFDALRKEAKKGKLILGICNGAQMIVESGLIPIAGDSLPLSLAENVRRDTEDHVIGTGYYNVWCNLKVERTDTAFTQGCQEVIKVPIAHGEGRFTTQKPEVLSALDSNQHVAFRYCDETGKVSEKYPVTPNGAKSAVAMIVNAEGTIGAIMPHPERFYKLTEGDQVLASMKDWILKSASPSSVEIGDLSSQAAPEVKKLEKASGTLYLEKKLIITDNENFSVKSTAENIVGHSLELNKSVVYAISGEVSEKEILDTGILANPNKEQSVLFSPKPNQVLVSLFEDDEALHLSEQLYQVLDKQITVRQFKAWDFCDTGETEDIEKILKNGLFCNPNAGELYMAYPDFA